MSKTITIKLTLSGPNVGPFNITNQFEEVIALDVTKKALIAGVSYEVSDNTDLIIIESFGDCKVRKVISLSDITIQELAKTVYEQSSTSCIWRHLTDIIHYNTYYGVIRPYVIEYPFGYQFQDEIVQNVKDYTKAYEYLPIPDGVFSYNTKIETNNKWFNKAILYNGQQSSGLLELVAKPMNNLQAYNSFPKYNTNSKTITYTKSDNFYLFNNFWALNISSQIPLFYTGCESLSIDKIINESNMDYSARSFRKAPLRAKELKVRMILDNSSTTHLVSQFVVAISQISYK
jgi:hypothetical protein